MRYPPGHNQQTRQRILDAAARVFRRDGFHAGGIQEVMKEANLTKGAFSQHFPSKEALLAQAFAAVLEQKMSALFAAGEGKEGAEWVHAVIGRYLSPEHVENVENGCPVPPLLSEIGRLGDEPRAAFTQKMRSGARKFTAHLTDDANGKAQEKALAAMAACYGALALARAVDDHAFAGRILNGVRHFLQRNLNSAGE